MVRTSIRGLAMSALLLAPVLAVQGCNASDNPLTSATDTLCCKDFKVGADLTKVDWGVSGDAKAEFGAFMQATADFAAVATATVTDLGNSCKAIAVDLGEADAETETDPGARATYWCGKAAAQINSLKAQGSITVSYQPPSCSFSASAQANCEASCTANASCQAELGDISARCDPGQLSGKCEATCMGTCEGSANVAVSCQGTCQGTCEGMCDGMAMNGEASGQCAGTCMGKCRGSCKSEASANIKCEADCTGGCSVTYKAPKCKVALKEPSASCKGSAECSGSCNASASAKAECKPGAVSIKADAKISATAIASLEANLPQIILIAKARGKILVDSAQTVVSLGASVQAHVGGDVKAKAVLCVVPAIAAIGDALGNANAALNASVQISGSIGG